MRCRFYSFSSKNVSEFKRIVWFVYASRVFQKSSKLAMVMESLKSIAVILPNISPCVCKVIKFAIMLLCVVKGSDADIKKPKEF